MDTAPTALGARLEGMATGGLLPPWNTWFAADPLQTILTNGSLRANFTADLPMVPIAWLKLVAPPLDAWSSLPCAYLQLSAAYAAEAGEAARRGWSGRRLELHHLAMITHPDKVAEALMSLETA